MSESVLLVWSEELLTYDLGATHPMAPGRLEFTMALAHDLGVLAGAATRIAAPRRATDGVLHLVHEPAYVAAVRAAGWHPRLQLPDPFGLGGDDNPVFDGIHDASALVTGATVDAAMAVRSGAAQHAVNLAGGLHHAMPARASGFCYLNDPVLGLLAWLDAGLDNLVYLDIDAHHGDGVQDAFADDPRVLTISIHEAGRWPGTGLAEDRAGGSARNLPVPRGFNDSEMRWLMERAVLPLIQARRPQAVMLQCGADALEEDPLARLSLSNNAHWAVAAALLDLAPRLVVTGGGGYNPYAVGRCWAGVWATLNGIPVPERTTPAAEAVLRALSYNRAAGRSPPEHWFTTLRDAPREGPVRDEVRRLAELTLEGAAPA